MRLPGLRSRVGHALLNAGARVLGDPLERDRDAEPLPFAPAATPGWTRCLHPTPDGPCVLLFDHDGGHLPAGSNDHVPREAVALGLPVVADELVPDGTTLVGDLYWPPCVCGHPFASHSFTVGYVDHRNQPVYPDADRVTAQAVTQTHCDAHASTCPCDSYRPRRTT